MTLGEKLAKARKEKNITQEQLADYLGISRQSISKWESDVAYPETDKLIRMSELFDCSLDYLLKENIIEKTEKPEASNMQGIAVHFSFSLSRIFNYEYKSKRTFRGIPLVHINIGIGKTAKGIVAIGFKSVGVLSIGLLSIGILSFGLLALGFLGLGVFGVGFLGFGAFALGLLSGGAISVGALAKGQYFAFGDNSTAMVALGATKANGTLYTHFTGIQNDFSGYETNTVLSILENNVPTALKWFMDMALTIAGVK